MDLALLAGLLWNRHTMRAREQLDRTALEAHQRRSLAHLLVHARERSPFYRRLHAGQESAPLDGLPVVTKHDLMEHFDDVVTDRRVSRAGLERFLATRHNNARYLGRYWVTATSGSSGTPGLLLFDRRDWAHVLASFTRGSDFAELTTGVMHPTRVAIVTSTNPLHMSCSVADSLRGFLLPIVSLDAMWPIGEIVQRLNAFQPEILVAYASMAGLLADEQAAGRLSVRPRAVMTGSEVLTDATRRRVEAAWGGGIVFDQYAATEGAGIAAECRQHRGLHLFEDLVIAEVVNGDNQPVPAGVTGERLLITVLWSRTQPLIRYVLEDSVRLAPEACPDGRTFRLTDQILGRTEDTLHLPGAEGGQVVVHPNIFHTVFDTLPVAAWQVLQEPDRLRVLIVAPHAGFDAAVLENAVRDALAAIGGRIDVQVEQVEAIPRAASGKTPLIRAERSFRPRLQR